MSKSKIEIINETVEFYGADLGRRSVTSDGRSCMYNSPNGNHCAFARCVSNPSVLMGYEGKSIFGLSENNVELFLKDEYKGHNIGFWFDIQGLHDYNPNWNLIEGKGLSDEGEQKFKKLIEKYS